MISSNPKEVVCSPTKAESNKSAKEQGKNTTKSPTTPWLRLKDPRIVRVSRALGGKDRHSKVCTIKGLRDRRVRLSVPTAIQLYDLQDRLGLNQPSKVIDWLLNVAKEEIDELPPLPISPENFSLSSYNHQAILNSSHEVGASQSGKQGFNKMSNVDGDNVNWEDPLSANWNSSDTLLRAKSKKVARGHTNFAQNENDQEKKEEEDNNEGGQVSPSNNFLRSRDANNSPSQGSMHNGSNNNPMPYNTFFHLEPTNFHSSHLGFSSQNEEMQNLNVFPLHISPLSLSTTSSTTQSYFPNNSHHTTTSPLEIDPRQLNHSQIHQNLFTQAINNSPNATPYSLNQSNIQIPFQYFITESFHSHESMSDRDQPSKHN